MEQNNTIQKIKLHKRYNTKHTDLGWGCKIVKYFVEWSYFLIFGEFIFTGGPGFPGQKGPRGDNGRPGFSGFSGGKGEKGDTPLPPPRDIVKGEKGQPGDIGLVGPEGKYMYGPTYINRGLEVGFPPLTRALWSRWLGPRPQSLKGEIRNRIKLISEERVKNFEQNSETWQKSVEKIRKLWHF